MPVLVIWFAWAIFPVIYSKDILGSVKDFSDCSVVKYDHGMSKMIATNETIEVAQVDHDIKLVQAKTYEGAIFGLGFVHAKDRLFQLHITRMLAQGRLSEVIGSSGVHLDRYIRQLGITRAAESRLKSLEPDEESVLANYAGGINKVVQNIKTYPLEFHVLFSSFEPWTVKDSVAC